MIEVKIPKEITQYEAKFVGPFTLRQTVCIGICLPACLTIYNLATQYMDLSANQAGYFCIIPAAIAFLFGWYKPYGMKFEMFVKSAFVNNVLAPNKRKYKTKNLYDIILKIMQEEAGSKEIVTVDKKGKRKKRNNKKYIKSKKAIK